ncbi:MAG: S1 RNA-binding domain-containing protein [Clostridia bacterium]|nr:S1 RNA-binding domain-containing protein [Clostridia bacterium]
MSLEVGSIVSGKVAKITNFGAFVKLSDGKSGLCHISEISSGFVKEVADVLELNQEVSVKILNINEEGKISLSIKQAQPAESEPNNNVQKKNFDKKRDFQKKADFQKKNDFQKKADFSRSPAEFGGYKDSKPKEENFEDMLSGYMKNSSDKLKNMKKVRSRKGNGFNR